MFSCRGLHWVEECLRSRTIGRRHIRFVVGYRDVLCHGYQLGDRPRRAGARRRRARRIRLTGGMRGTVHRGGRILHDPHTGRGRSGCKRR